jgi:hypothetical protein
LKKGIPVFERIVYRDLWPGIDLVFSGGVNELKHEFVVEPGADISRIRLAYRGASDLSLDALGRMTVETPAGELSDGSPIAFQFRAGEQVEVPVRFALDRESRSYSFEVGA